MSFLQECYSLPMLPNAPRRILVLALMLLSALAGGLVAKTWLVKSPSVPQPAPTSSLRTSNVLPTRNSPLSSLTISSELYYSADDPTEPRGHILTFSGALNQTLLVTQEIDVQPRNQLPLLTGTLIHTDGYEWNGLHDDLMYVRSGDTLQVERQISLDDDAVGSDASGPLPREVMMTLDVPSTTMITFHDATNTPPTNN